MMARVVLTSGAMAGAKRYQDLICWQLADELETLVVALTDTGPVSKDFKFHHANFLRIARSSLMETHNSARTGFKRGYFSADEHRQNAATLRALGEGDDGTDSLSRVSNPANDAAESEATNLNR
jgi:hypothetical protein